MNISRRKILFLGRIGLVGTGATVLSGAIAFLAVGQARYANRFYPGVNFDDEHIGGLTLNEVRERLESRWDAFADTPVTFRLGEKTWRPMGSEVGISVDYATPLSEAFSWGRLGGVFRRFEEQRTTLDLSRSWSTRVRFDPRVFMDYVDRLAMEVHQPVVDAAARIVDKGGRREIVIDSARAGRELIPLDYMAVMSDQPERPRYVVIHLRARSVAPSIVTASVSPVAEEARDITSGHIELVAPGHRWAIAREALASEMAIEGPPSAPRLQVTANYLAFDRVAREIARTLGIPAIEPKIRVDLNGTIVPLAEGLPGRKVETETLWARVQAAFETRQPRVNIPLLILRPTITSLSEQDLQFDNLIAEGTSEFVGSKENRIHNIENGSRLIDGAVLAPGETFSFNETVGKITLENGFVEGLVIAPNQTEPGVGGGICQVSTTLFRAVFWAGLPISERWQHVYRVGYYELGPKAPPGFDAAIWQPAQDLVFTNDTPSHILIRRIFDPENFTLQFQLRGPATGRHVELKAWEGDKIDPPPMRIEPTDELPEGQAEQTDTAIPGLKTIVHRKVLLNGRVLVKNNFLSFFKPWPERWEVGQAEDGTFDPKVVPGYTPPEPTPDAEPESANPPNVAED